MSSDKLYLGTCGTAKIIPGWQHRCWQGREQIFEEHDDTNWCYHYRELLH